MQKKTSRTKRILINLTLGILLLVLLVLVSRVFSSRQVDDVSPSIECSQEIIDKSETLMIIPLFENKSIAENKSWCEYILSLNKTLGMHGVYHTYKEFGELRDEKYIQIGIDEFKKCFGFYPKIFEAPQLALSSENAKILKGIGFDVRGWFYTFTPKVYHCQETGKFTTTIYKNFKLTNRLIDRV